MIPLNHQEMILELQYESENLNPSQKKSLSVALSSITRMEDIVSQLLNFARPTPMTFVPTQLNHLIEDSLAFLKLQLDTEKIVLRKNLSLKLPLLELDEKHVKEAMINVFLNAIQAIASKNDKTHRRIVITTKLLNLRNTIHDISFAFLKEKTGVDSDLSLVLYKGTRCALVQVNDTGNGIDPEEMRRIFDPFFTTKINGTGLGMAMVKRTVNAHGGIVTVKSKLDIGTTIRIYLPLN